MQEPTIGVADSHACVLWYVFDDVTTRIAILPPFKTPTKPKKERAERAEKIQAPEFESIAQGLVLIASLEPHMAV